MRRSNRRLLKAVVIALASSGGGGAPPSQRSGAIYTTTPHDLAVADDRLRRLEQEWVDAGIPQSGEPQVDQALQNARSLQIELNHAKARSYPGITLMYLYLVRWFVLSRLPGFGKMPVLGGSAAIVCALALFFSPFIYPKSLLSALGCALVLTVAGSSLATIGVFCLWPTEAKRQSFQRLQKRRKEYRTMVETLTPGVASAWADYESLRKSLDLCVRLEKARKKRDDLAALLSSEKYQLIHADWRAMRGTDFENFLSRVFQTLGYQVQLTKASGDQGADLLLTGKARKIAVQAKGYAGTVGNHSVMEVVAGMTFYGCDSCVVITNSHFTSTAIRLAQATGCGLIDEVQIPDLIEGRIY